MKFKTTQLLATLGLTLMSLGASAAPVYWTDWTSNTGTTATGVITTGTSTVNVSYSNPQGMAFVQTSGGTDFWANNWAGNRNDAVSPYTSALVDNAPTGTDIVSLYRAGSQTLSFSQTIANPVFSFVSLNSNGYGFTQDFDILSQGGVDGNVCGVYGCGTSYKNVVTLGDGSTQYQLLGTGEPHGTIRFTGAFSSVSWNSLSNEYWNGFTVGVQGTAQEVFTSAVPEPETYAMMLAGLGLMGAVARRRRAKQA